MKKPGSEKKIINKPLKVKEKKTEHTIVLVNNLLKVYYLHKQVHYDGYLFLLSSIFRRSRDMLSFFKNSYAVYVFFFSDRI